MPKLAHATGTGTRATLRAHRLGAVARLGDIAFLVPIAAVVGVTIIWPTISAVTHSFTNWDPGFASPWVGLHNYSYLINSPTFHQILENEGFLLFGLPLWVFGPVVIATALHERVPAAAVFRTILFFPATVSPAVIGILFVMILAPSGPLDTALHGIGLGALAGDWLANTQLVKPTLIFVLAWATMGTGVVIFSAALGAVPQELFEAADLDGATWWQRFFFVVLPGVRRIIELWAVILVITVFVGVFPWIFTLTRGGPGYSSTTIDFDIYQNALTFGYFGIAAAESVILLIIVAIVITIGRVVFRRMDY